MEPNKKWPFTENGDVEWDAALSVCGQPVESSILTDEEWDTAKCDGRVVSIVSDESGMTYCGLPGLSTNRVMCRVVFNVSIPAAITLTDVVLADINWDFSNAALATAQATDRLLAASTVGDLQELQAALTAGADLNHQQDNENLTSTPLGLAVSNGHEECVKTLIRAGAHVTDHNGSALWRLAILTGHSRIADLLETHGVRPALQESLIQAAHEGNCAAITDLIGRGADLNVSSSLWSPYHLDGTPLTVALLSGHRPVIDALIALAADPEKPDDLAVTPWIAAAATVQTDICSFLESRGATADIQAALVLASRLGNCDAIKALLQLGADPNGQAVIGRGSAAPLEAAFESTDIGRYLGQQEPDDPSDGTETHRCAVIALLLSQGADPNVRGRGSRPLVLRAVDMLKVDALDLFLRHGADVDMSDDEGNTALHEAIEQGKEECAKRLLLAGANPNSTDAEGKVPFMRLFSESREPSLVIAKWVIAFGAKLDVVTKGHKSIRTFAKRALRKAKEEGRDTEGIRAILDLLDDGDSLAANSGVMATKAPTVDNAFARATCGFWLQDAQVASDELARAVELHADSLNRVSRSLCSDNWWMRYIAALALGKIGAAADVAIPRLVELLNDDDLDVVNASETALASIGSKSVPQLLSAVQSLPPQAACRACA